MDLVPALSEIHADSPVKVTKQSVHYATCNDGVSQIFLRIQLVFLHTVSNKIDCLTQFRN